MDSRYVYPQMLPFGPTIDRFKEEENLVQVTLNQALRGNDGPDSKRKRRSDLAKRREELKNIVINYQNVDFSTFMDILIAFFDK